MRHDYLLLAPRNVFVFWMSNRCSNNFMKYVLYACANTVNQYCRMSLGFVTQNKNKIHKIKNKIKITL